MERDTRKTTNRNIQKTKSFIYKLAYILFKVDRKLTNKILVRNVFGNWNYVRCRKSDLIFELEDDAEIFVTDWQLGHENVNENKLKDLVAWALMKPHRYFVLQDFLDDKWLSKFSKLSYGSDEELEELNRVKKQIKILEPILHRFLFQVGSNHWMRRFGLHLSPKRSQKARTQFNEIYGKIYDANPDFKMYHSTQCIPTLKFRTQPNLKIPFIHPSRLGSPTTALNRASNYFGYYGIVIGHIHANIRQAIQSVMGKKLRIWFASHLFGEQPEYEKERMATFQPSEPLILGWKKNPLTGRWEFDRL